jgi:inner membrane protein
MDSLTHIVLGGALGQCLGRRRAGRAAFWLGAWAATVPDLDVFWYTGHSVPDHLAHRTALHSLLLVPVLALFAFYPFMLNKKVRAAWPHMYLLAFLAVLSHPLLDANTSYGTMMFWPFSADRISWDTISVVDPIFTGILILGVLITAFRKRPTFAAAALALSIAYLGLGFWQHHRAWQAQEAIAASRHQTIDAARVMPTLGNLLVWRSIYLSDGIMHADAIRTPLFSPTQFAPGLTLPQIRPENLDPATPQSARADFANFFALTGGFVGQPSEPGLYVDERYSLETTGFHPFWGIRIANGIATWEIINPRNIPEMPRYILREALGKNADFVPLSALSQ